MSADLFSSVVDVYVKKGTELSTDYHLVDVRGQLVAAMKSLYKQSEVCVHVNGMKTKPFSASVGLQQGYVLSLLFIIYMDKIDRENFSSSGITFGECNIRCLLFADDLTLLSLNKSDFQYALDQFSDVCLDAGMKISMAKTSGGYSNLGARGKNFQKLMLSEKKKRSDLGLHIFLPKSKCSLKKKKKRSSLRIVL